jgi:Flp pilus assembly pilin Flp
MSNLLQRLWKDEGGALISIEWVFVATILVIGVTTGLVAVRNAVNSELVEVANAFTSLCQSYFFTGTELRCECGGGGCGNRGHGCVKAWTCGSAAFDVNDRQEIHNKDMVVPNCIESCPCN